MSDLLQTSGMVLKAFDHAEYDRRLIVLTKDVGKITVFAKGVRRQGSKNMAASEPFVYGNFKLFVGKSAYNLAEADVVNFFEEVRFDMERMCYASFFADIVEYSTRENNDEALVLKLLYRTMQALVSDKLENGFVNSVFLLKLIMLNGEYAGAESEGNILPGTKRAIEYIEESDIKDLFAFRVKEEAGEELKKISLKRRDGFVKVRLKSLEVMNDMGYN